MADPLKHSPLHWQHKKLGARLVPYSGWELPIQYQGIRSEHRAVRERVGLFDVSHMGEIEMTGSQAVEVVDGLVTNALGRIEPGRAMYTCCCNERGGILDDLIIYKHAPDRVLTVCNAANREKIVEHFRQAATGRCDFHDASDETALMALQGPQALETVSAAGCGINDVAANLGNFRFRDTTVAGITCTVARTGYTGEDGVELFCAANDAPRLWEALLTAGQQAGIEPAGLGARDTLRLEARLSLYGNEIDETTHPYEAGLGWTVKLDAGDFLGREALARIKQQGLQRKLVGFEMTGRGIARHGYSLLDQSAQPVGICTSGAPSPTLGKSIGLGYLPVSISDVGTEFLVDCRGKSVPAIIVKTPFYKRPKAG